MEPDQQIEYGWIIGVEQLERYVPGGYHPIMIDDLLHDRYRVVDKLGYGGYSTIWLCHNVRLRRYVAVKVGISEPSLPRREPAILRDLSTYESEPISHTSIGASDATPRILDEFKVQGPNGSHPCYVISPAQGNLREASYSHLFPIQVARAMAAKMTMAVAFIHSRGVVHGDVHLWNILVKLPSTFDDLSIDQFRDIFGEPETEPITRIDREPLTRNVPPCVVLPLYLGKEAEEFTLEDARGLVLSDFSGAFYPATDIRLGRDCNTPVARKAPEAVFEPDALLSYPSDVWCLAGSIWEILGMKFIFGESAPEDVVAAEQIDVLGYDDFPPSWREHWERPRGEKGSAYEGIPCRPSRPPGAKERQKWPPLEVAFEEFVQKYRREWGEMRSEWRDIGVFGEEETRAILDLMRGMFKFQPEERLTVEQVLSSPWMVKWALPALGGKPAMRRTR